MKLKKFYISILLLFLFTGCGKEQHIHKWTDATCTSPQKCEICNKEEGDSRGHQWMDATCSKPKTCSVCNLEEGDPLPHQWVEADCANAKTCSVCNKKDGEAKGHKWEEADCKTPKTCSVCGETSGTVAPHNFVGDICEEKTICDVCGKEGSILEHEFVDATCTEKGHCKRCNKKCDALGHDYVAASCEDPTKCSRCGEEGKALGHSYLDYKCEKCKAYEVITLSNGYKISTKPSESCGDDYQIIGAKITRKSTSRYIDISLKFKYHEKNISEYKTITYGVVKAYDKDGYEVQEYHIYPEVEGENTDVILVDTSLNISYFEMWSDSTELR